MRIRKERDFMSFFCEKTGEYVRTGIMKEGMDTGIDPFMASFPELLDVGIMGHCAHGKSGLCLKAGVYCYQDGLHSEFANMSVEDFKEIVEQCKGNTYQIALGGCGDPDQHECFEEILKICKDARIVPNFTTSGLGMTEECAKLCKEYCGAVAVSWYRSNYTIRAIQNLINVGVKTNIHYVLSKNSIKEAIERIKENSFPKGIKAIVFLLHKPVGLGKKQDVLSLEHGEVQEFMELISKGNVGYKIGFDSCSVPALLNYSKNIDFNSLDTCEGARWSAYISHDMKMMPCSFDNQDLRWAVDLRKHTIQEAWNSEEFENFRNHFRLACPDCIKRELCMGGCPICPEIVLCDKHEKTEKYNSVCG